MDSKTGSLEDLINECLPAGGFNVGGGRDWFMEVRDTTTGRVWMSSSPVQLADFETLELDETLVKVGIARAPMDRAAFCYSPGTPDEPVLERVINGRHYINVAIPQEVIPPTQPGGAIEISVNKAHVIGFEAGRSVVVMSLPEGDFVEVVGAADADAALLLPEGAILRQLDLTQPWVVSLPTPTRTFFWFGENLRSFQGPVTLPVSA
ncbi:MAG: hypothetical protein V7700_03640 [Halioglobus sp.]